MCRPSFPTPHSLSNTVAGHIGFVSRPFSDTTSFTAVPNGMISPVINRMRPIRSTPFLEQIWDRTDLRSPSFAHSIIAKSLPSVQSLRTRHADVLHTSCRLRPTRCGDAAVASNHRLAESSAIRCASSTTREARLQARERKIFNAIDKSIPPTSTIWFHSKPALSGTVCNTVCHTMTIRLSLVARCTRTLTRSESL